MATGATFKSALEGTTLDELSPLSQILELELKSQSSGFVSKSQAEQVWSELSYFGSNNLAYLLRGMEGVDYPEIVRDVCERMKVENVREGQGEKAIVANERALLAKIFANAWDAMSEQEKEVLRREMNLGTGSGPVSGAAVAATILAGEIGGFTTYRLTIMVANWVARALLGRGLTFGANAALARVLGTVLGPVGWVVSGAWFVNDLASPAFRKTLPAVVQVAALRELRQQRATIGIVGAGAAGKDSLLRELFGIDTGRIDPIPGSTSAVETYGWPRSSRVRVMNFPGFEDLREHVNEQVWDQLHNCNLILSMVNVTEVPLRTVCEDYLRAANSGAEVITIFNKCDRADQDEFDRVIAETRQRLSLEEAPVLLSLSRRHGQRWLEPGLLATKQRIDAWARRTGREPIFDLGLERTD